MPAIFRRRFDKSRSSIIKFGHSGSARFRLEFGVTEKLCCIQPKPRRALERLEDPVILIVAGQIHDGLAAFRLGTSTFRTGVAGNPSTASHHFRSASLPRTTNWP